VAFEFNVSRNSDEIGAGSDLWQVVGPSKKTYTCSGTYAVTLVWGSLRFASIKYAICLHLSHKCNVCTTELNPHTVCTYAGHVCHNFPKQFNTIVSHIYAPRFANLALVESVGGGGGLYAGSVILSREYAPSSGATPRC